MPCMLEKGPRGPRLLRDCPEEQGLMKSRMPTSVEKMLLLFFSQPAFCEKDPPQQVEEVFAKSPVAVTHAQLLCMLQAKCMG